MKTSLLVEFPDAAALASAARALRGRPELTLDAYTPYSSEEVREALALPPSRLPYFVFVAACLGAGIAYWLEWFTTAYQYPINVGGRPLHMPLAFVPIAFEMGVLAASVTAVVGLAGRIFSASSGFDGLGTRKPKSSPSLLKDARRMKCCVWVAASQIMMML